MSWLKPILAIAALLAATTQTALADGPIVGQADCPAERAVYQMTAPGTNDSWQLAFIPARSMPSIASDLYLRLTTPQRDYWFIFNVSQGYSGISIFPVTSPHGENGPHDLLGPPFGDNPDGTTNPDVFGALRFLSFDDDLNVDFEPPMRGEMAPPFVMLPELGLALWYDAISLTDDTSADRDPMPRGVFKRTQCRVKPYLEAGPQEKG